MLPPEIPVSKTKAGKLAKPAAQEAQTDQVLVSVIEPRDVQDVTVKAVLDAVCNVFRVPAEMLLGASRQARITQARQVAMFLLRVDLKRSFPQIAKDLGRKDHTTVMHGCSKIEENLKSDRWLFKQIEKVWKVYSDQTK